MLRVVITHGERNMDKKDRFRLSSVMIFMVCVFGIMSYITIFSSDIETNTIKPLTCEDDRCPIPNTSLVCNKSIYVDNDFYCSLEDINNES